MTIKDMILPDIERKIQGVVQVEQKDTLYQEMKEYVVTKEHRKLFVKFFNNYNESFTKPNTDIGVWISGFFGSGKSHFLKMLAYLLENKELTAPDGTKTTPVEIFREKFADDPLFFKEIENATAGETDIVLYNICIENSITNQEKYAIIKNFSKTFYDKLGYYGNNLKVVELEKELKEQGKTEEFAAAFEKYSGSSWKDGRNKFQLKSKYVVQALQDVLGMDEEIAKQWISKSNATEFSIKDLVTDIKAYIDTKPANYKFLFMLDEVGQFVGADTSLLLELQSIVEQIGSECHGKVWVMCTGQEALDQVIKTRTDEFSRIQARFYTQLKLNSTAVDEVVQERILKKKEESVPELNTVYKNNEAALRNIFAFSESQKDIKGYSSELDFAKDFPFVPYQFLLLQKVFDEIREHGNVGKHQSNGARSMLSGFQEALQNHLKDKNEFTLAPFYLFYDTLNEFLDTTIRLVIDRCQRAAENHDGIEENDVKVLKLLYLIRYVDDIPATVDNLVILMADSILMDKVTKRKEIQESLDRLLSQNYIGRSGEKYNFLTNEEQDIQKNIFGPNNAIERAKVQNKIGEIVFNDLFAQKKFRYGSYDFSFEQFIDDIAVSSLNSNGLRLKIMTVATDPTEKNELTLIGASYGRAIIVLDGSNYYENLEKALRIRNYAKSQNMSQLSQSTRDIIQRYQSEAGKYEADAKDDLVKAICESRIYVDGQLVNVTGSTAKEKISNTLEQLVGQVYKKLDLITFNASTDNDILDTLSGRADNGVFPGNEPNREAADDIYQYLQMQAQQALNVQMSDIQSRYQGTPYGWNEIDIANAVARLIYEQKITVKYSGNTLQSDNTHLPDFLRKKSEIGKTNISLRQSIPANEMKKVREFLREYFGVQDIPDDEDGVVKYIIDKFNDKKQHYNNLLNKYNIRAYPDKDKVQTGISLCDDVLSQAKDNTALVTRTNQKSNDLLDNKDDLINIENFFSTQQTLFDNASDFYKSYKSDSEYLSSNKDALEALTKIGQIVDVTPGPQFNYRNIPELNIHMSTVKSIHTGLLAAKRKDLLDLVDQCISAVKAKANGDSKADSIVSVAESFFNGQISILNAVESIALLDSYILSLSSKKDTYCQQIEAALKPTDPQPNSSNGTPAKNVKPLYKTAIFQGATLSSNEEIDAYVESLRSQLKAQLNGFDAIELK